MRSLFILLFIVFFPIVAFAQPPDSLWSRTFGGSSDDECYSVQQTSDGGYILGGETYSYGAGGYDFWLVKTDADGDSIWSRTFGGGGSDACYSVQQTTDGGYILGGGDHLLRGGRLGFLAGEDGQPWHTAVGYHLRGKQR